MISSLITRAMTISSKCISNKSMVIIVWLLLELMILRIFNMKSNSIEIRFNSFSSLIRDLKIVKIIAGILMNLTMN
jgi:hypothetical protein